MEVDELNLARFQSQRHLNFAFQVLFIGLLSALTSFYLIPNTPPDKPAVTWAEAQSSENAIAQQLVVANQQLSQPAATTTKRAELETRIQTLADRKAEAHKLL